MIALNTETFLLILGGGAFLVMIVALVLHRSWGGSMPSRYDVSQYYHKSPPSPTTERAESFVKAINTPQPPTTPTPPDDEHGDVRDLDVPDDAPPPPIPDSGLILIHHPLLLKVIQQSLAHGGAARQYVVQEDDQIYVSLDLIKNPVERRRAAEMIHNFQTTGTYDVWDMYSISQTFVRNRPRT